MTRDMTRQSSRCRLNSSDVSRTYLSTCFSSHAPRSRCSCFSFGTRCSCFTFEARLTFRTLQRNIRSASGLPSDPPWLPVTDRRSGEPSRTSGTSATSRTLLMANTPALAVKSEAAQGKGHSQEHQVY